MAHARSLLPGAETAASVADAAQAKTGMAQFLMLNVDFPPPEPAAHEPGSPELVELVQVADAADRALLLCPFDRSDFAVYASISVQARRSLALADRTGHGPLLGLAMAVEAFLHSRAGEHDLASAEAHQAARLLSELVARAPEQGRPALVLALDAAAVAHQAAGRSDQAKHNHDRALVLLQAMAADDERYQPDLEARLEGAASPSSPADAGASAQPSDPAGLAAAQALFDEAVRLGREQRLAPAESTVAEAVAAFRRLDGAHARRGLALALWRQSMYRHAIRRGDRSCLTLGEEAVAMWDDLIAAPAPPPVTRSELQGELARACSDISILAVEAGEARRALPLATRAVELARELARAGAEADLGTALHNLATVHLALGNLPVARAVVDEATTFRNDASRSPSASPLTRWELASSLALSGQIRAHLGQVADGVTLVTVAAEIAEALREPSLVFKVKAAIEDLRRADAGAFRGKGIDHWLA